MSNFTFIKTDFPALFNDANEAEQLTYVSPKAAAIFCRSTLENAINWLYDNDAKLTRPFRTDLSTLMHEHEFRSLFAVSLFGELNLIRKTGNLAAHDKAVSQQDALASLKYLFRFLRYLAIYYGKKAPDTQAFDETLIPKPESDKPDTGKQDAKKIEKLLGNLDYKNKQARLAKDKIREQAQENAALKKNSTSNAKQYRRLKSSVKKQSILIRLDR